MTVEILGYVQSRLVGHSRRATAGRLEESARAYGGTARLYYESPNPARALWRLVETLDARSGSDLAARLWQAADEQGIDLRRLLGGPPPAAALLALLGALAESETGYLLVPSPAHLDGLAVSRSALRHLIARIAPQCRVIFLDPDPAAGGRGLVAEVEVVATAPMAVEIVTAHVQQNLRRRALTDVLDPVLAVVTELVSEAVHAADASASALGSRVRVEVLCPPQSPAVVVDVIETRDHTADPISAVVQRICTAAHATADRSRTGAGGTLTRCWVPLPDSLPATTPLPRYPGPSMPEGR